MNIEVDREDLLILLKAIEPNSSEYYNPILCQYGDYVGGFNNKWIWNYMELNRCETQTLFELLLICKNSYKK